jgi:hypothetical protein
MLVRRASYIMQARKRKKSTGSTNIIPVWPCASASIELTKVTYSAKVMERNPVILRVSPYSAPLEMLPLPTMVDPEYLTSASDSATSLSPTETSRANENFNELLRAQASSFSSFSLGRTTPNSPPTGNGAISAYDQMNTATPSPINTGSQTSPSIPAVSRKNSVASITSSLFHPFRSRRASSVTSISSTETASTSTSDKPNEITIDFTSQEGKPSPLPLTLHIADVTVHRSEGVSQNT